MGDQRSTRRRYLAAVGAVGTAGRAGGADRLAGELLKSGIDASTRERYIEVATRTAAELDEWHRARIGTTKRLAQADVVQNGTPDEQTRWLRTEAQQLPEDVVRVDLIDRSREKAIFASSAEARVDTVLYTREAPWKNRRLEYGENGVFAPPATVASAG